MNRFNKYNSYAHQIPFPCAFPLPPIGPTGATGPGIPPIFAEVVGPVAVQVVPAATTALINFTGGTRFGDGSIQLVNGTNIILPEIGTYFIAYAVSMDINADAPPAVANVNAVLIQRNASNTFVAGVSGTPLAIRLLFSDISNIGFDNADSEIFNSGFVSVIDTGGGDLNNILQLQVGTFNDQDTNVRAEFQGINVVLLHSN
ncbi:hypothetical protein II5_06001 [Bacillus cereus MSX-A1]|uniref:hypothetical protein n=1 Tax=Bacillus cereus TaxID=1396 RepID=UPI000279540B|nr:hypothetical protein [Bacillus cereus]EJQ97271.1 hypothetical protein II5_06001 [Bacillus cereus MSX-A1]MDR4292617.1 hypothetical protein [Bacillus cereus]